MKEIEKFICTCSPSKFYSFSRFKKNKINSHYYSRYFSLQSQFSQPWRLLCLSLTRFLPHFMLSLSHTTSSQSIVSHAWVFLSEVNSVFLFVSWVSFELDQIVMFLKLWFYGVITCYLWVGFESNCFFYFHKF